MGLSKEIADNQVSDHLATLWLKLLFGWMVLQTAPYLVFIFTLKPYWSSRSTATAIIEASILSAASTVIYGLLLGVFRLWRKYGLASIALGTAGLLLCYVISMFTLSPGDPSADNAAAVGIIIIGIPVAAIETILLALGLFLSTTISVARRRIKEGIAKKALDR